VIIAFVYFNLRPGEVKEKIHYSSTDNRIIDGADFKVI